MAQDIAEDQQQGLLNKALFKNLDRSKWKTSPLKSGATKCVNEVSSRRTDLAKQLAHVTQADPVSDRIALQRMDAVYQSAQNEIDEKQGQLLKETSTSRMRTFTPGAFGLPTPKKYVRCRKVNLRPFYLHDFGKAPSVKVQSHDMKMVRILR